MLIYSDRYEDDPIDIKCVATIMHDLHEMSDNELICLAAQELNSIPRNFYGNWSHLGDVHVFAENLQVALDNARAERSIYWLLQG